MEIPEDIARTAHKLAHFIGGADGPFFTDDIARALLAERERCALVAEAHDRDPETAEEIASAIRSTSPSKANPS